MKKRIASLVMAAAITFGAISAFMLTASAAQTTADTRDGTGMVITDFVNELETKEIDDETYRVIYDVYDWVLFANLVNSNNGNTYPNSDWNAIVEPAGATIDFSELGTMAYPSDSWQKVVTIGASSNGYYSGTFNGNGCTIVGLEYESAYNYGAYSLFGYTDTDAHISNITVENADLTATNSHYLATFVRENKGTLENCHAVNVTVSSAKSSCGGIAYTNAGTIKNCSFSGSVVSGSSAGGIAGSASSGAQFIECWNDGDITGKITSATSGNYAGGILAQENSAVTINNCYNTGDISGYYAAGIVGSRYGYGTVTSCHNYGGTITGTKTYPIASGNGVANCYYLADSETDNVVGTTYKTEEEFADATVLALLNGDNTETVWEEHPHYPVLVAKKIPHIHNFSYTLEGDDTITAICANTDNKCGAVNGGSVTLSSEDSIYDGEDKAAELTYTDWQDDEVTVTYEYKSTEEGTYEKTDDITNAGYYKATVTLGDVYVVTEYTVSPIALTENMVTLDPETYEYDGTTKTVTVTVENDGTALIFGTDYTVEGTASTDKLSAGDGYEVTVIGKGNYEGEVTKYWTLTKAKFKGITAESADVSYDGGEYGITVDLGEYTGVTVYYGETEGTYDLTESPKYTEAGEYTVYFKVSGEGYEDYVGSASVKMRKVDQDAPAAPITKGKTATTVELEIASVEGFGEVQYAYSAEDAAPTAEDAWQTSALFEGLAKDTAYYFFARFAGDNNHEPSPASKGIEIKTFNAFIVNFDADGGKGTMADVTVTDGVDNEYTLPECGFTESELKHFKAWSIGGTEYAVGDKFTVTADTTVTAVWEDLVASVTVDDITEDYTSFADALDAASAASGDITVTLLRDVDVTEEINIESGKFIIDLNGKTVATEDVYAIDVGGSETEITVVSTNGTGTFIGDWCIAAKNGGTLTLSSDVLLTGAMGAASVYTSDAELIIDGASFVCGDEDAEYKYAIYVYLGTLTFKNGSVSEYEQAIYYYRDGETNAANIRITGGTISADDAVFAYAEYKPERLTVSIEGGTFPNGVKNRSINNSAVPTLADILAEGYAFYQDGTAVILEDGQTELEGETEVKAGVKFTAEHISFDKASADYTGAAHTPSVIVTVNGAKLTEGTDYEVTAPNNMINQGTYTFTVTGKGMYYGSAEISYTITPKDIADATITLGDALTYNGAEQTQTIVSVIVDGLTVTYDITESTDKGIIAGDYTVTITGNGNFKGTTAKAWTIAQAIPTSNKLPTAEDIRMYSKLRTSALVGGVMCGADGKAIEGTFSWKYPDIEMDVNGDSVKTVVFTPIDTVNYEVVELDVKVNVYSIVGIIEVILDKNKDKYKTVSFDSNGIADVDSQEVTLGTTSDEPEVSEKEGYTFEGWYIAPEFTEIFDFEAPIKSEITLYAKWTKTVSDNHDTGDEDDECKRDANCPLTGFTDLKVNEWYHDGVHYAIEGSLMSGMGEGVFEPNGTTTRAMIATILWRLEDKPVVNYLMQFEDVEADTWYTEAIRWAASESIVEGYSDFAFGPSDAITREQLATILYRYAEYKGHDIGVSADLSGYTDVDQVSDWALKAIKWACCEEIINGIPGDILAPTGNTTRAQAATMLYRFITGNN